MDYKKTLLSPIKIGERTCENRFFAQSMECCDADEHGNPSELTLKRYEKLYKGHFGLIDLEAITITRECRSRQEQLAILPENIPALTNFIKRLKEVNPKALIVFQLTHAGELANPEFSKRMTVKNVYGMEGELISEEEIDKIIEEFVVASKVTRDIGADGIDMKFCHGYLGSQILRPYNDRKWKYGGSWENRSRFAFDLYEKIAKAVGDKNFLIGSKLSMWEAFPGGFGSAGADSPLMDMTEPISLIKGLEERGAQYFVESLGNCHCSMNLMESMPDEPYLSYLHIYFAELMKRAVKPETVIIGSHFSPFRGKKSKLLSVKPGETSLFNMGGRCIEEGMMDMIGLGRQSFADPLTPLKLEEGREDEVHYCTQCMNCEELMIRQKQVGCAAYNKYYAKMLLETRNEKGKLKELHT